MVALIAYLLLASLRKTQKSIESPLAFARLVRANLMHRKTIPDLIERTSKPKIDTSQMQLELGLT
ncbi:hypothetical protein D3C87_1992960 [compost metagenome]